MNARVAFAACALVATLASANEPLKRQMVVHKVTELGLEIWTEANPEWEAQLAREPGAPRPVFAAETPGQTYPPAGMSWAVPGFKTTDTELQRVARSALRQAALNYGLKEEQIRGIDLEPASYGSLTGYEAQFPAAADGVPVDVRVFFGHRPGKPVVAMQVFTLRGKLPHLSEQIRRSWSHVNYLE